MKKLLQAATLLLFVVPASAQDIRESQVRLGKEDRSAFVATYSYDDEIVQGALEERLKEAGLKRDGRKSGYALYKQETWTDLSTNKLDFYIRVDGRKGKSTLSFVASKGYNNDITSANDPGTAGNIRNFLTAMEQQINAYAVKLEIAAKEKAAAEVAKKNKAIKKDLEENEKEKRKHEEDLKDLKNKL